MRAITLAASLAVMGVAGAWSADCIVDGAPLHFTAPAPEGRDSTLELKWDTGTRRWSVSWYTGAGYWVGNDFDVSTLKWPRAAIRKLRFYTRGAWPNGRWDGVRLAIYNFSTVPGSMLWPTAGGGYFFKPSAPIQSHIWVECDINWTCPSPAFVGAEEQYYTYPNNDAFSLDNNPTFRGHSWEYSGGSWKPFPEYLNLRPYRNVMLRVVVDDETVSVAPTSLGRVKALYY